MWPQGRAACGRPSLPAASLVNQAAAVADLDTLSCRCQQPVPRSQHLLFLTAAASLSCLYCLYCHPPVQYAAFEDEVGVYLVTEYASRGDVFGELDRRGGSMTEADAVRQVLSPFLSALEYLHMLNIIHRDIKPENLLFTATGVLKVAGEGRPTAATQAASSAEACRCLKARHGRAV